MENLNFKKSIIQSLISVQCDLVSVIDNSKQIILIVWTHSNEVVWGSQTAIFV